MNEFQQISPTASWVFGSILLLFLIVVVFALREPTQFQMNVIRFLMALTAGFFAIFFVGGLLLKGSMLGFAVSSTGGFALFVLIQFIYHPFEILPTPTPDENKLKPLNAIDCSQESALKSRRGNTLTYVKFVNDTLQVVKLYWINYEGERMLMDTLQPGESKALKTYLTHPFVFTDLNEKCLAIYLPNERPSIATLQSNSR